MNMSSIPTLENFDCGGEPTSVGVRWEKWKRAFEVFLQALDVTEHGKKRAILLHTAGLQLQDIYYNIPGAHIEEAEDTDVYKTAITKLDEYFSPKQSKIYERHLFRLMKQESDEKLEKFLVRLRHQADKCKFSNIEENLIDQITEKCSSAELRKKILISGDKATLETILTEANTLEAVNRQLEGFYDKTTTSVINKIETKRQSYTKNCTRCGYNDHLPEDKMCPARNKKCTKCGYIGHFHKYCKTRKRKRNKENFDNKDTKSYQGRQRKHEFNPVKTTKGSDEDVRYVFHIDNDAELHCEIGTVPVTMLIDSGCKCNLITEGTWQSMKTCHVEISNQVKNPDKIFLSYGNTTPLDVIGSFEANIAAGTTKTRAEFFVVRGGTKNLLGKNTAVALNVLRVGFLVNAVEEYPKFKNVSIDIPIDDTVKPISQPYRRIPIPLEEKVNRKLQELVDADIIEAINKPSKWVSPMVPILKENGDIRICIDMRRANMAVIRENYPLPTMDILLPNFRKAKYFTKLDIKNAFHQVEITPSSRDITTFITSKGLYRYKRLMFGITCAPELFQKIMDKMLLSCEGTVVFIDDILIFGATLEEHDNRLTHTMRILNDHNVFLNTEKCIYRATTIQFLGHELSQTGVRPLTKYITTIQEFRPPKTIDEIQSFLGLVNFVGKWIQNMATITEPLRKLLRMKLGKHANITTFWKTEQDLAFHNLKIVLTKIPTLGYYDPHDRTQVIADASPVGLGAILIQFDHNGPRVIAYGNKSLTDCEKRYCQTEKEALSLVWAVEHFKIYLIGKNEFELVTDHKPLEVIFGPRSKPCARIERWVLRLQAFKYKVIYRPGKFNIADSLSRLGDGYTAQPFENENYVNQILEYARPIAVSLQDIKTYSGNDTEITKVRDGIYHDTWDTAVNTYKLFETELCYQEGILLRGTRIVIPVKLRQRVLEAAHEGHPGIMAMKTRLRTKVWWPRIDKDAENWVKNCKGCTLVSAPDPPNPLKRRILPTAPWIDIAIDFLGPLPSGQYIFVIIDYFSRYKELKITKNTTSEETVKMLKETFSRVGFPMTITADNGKQFISESFHVFCRENNITLYNTIPYWPQQNGEVERQNRSILKRLRISQVEKKDWQDDLLTYLIMYNSTPHSVTGKTPSELFYHRLFRDKIPTLHDIEHKIIDDETSDRDHELKEKGKEYSDRRRKATIDDLEPGQKVYVKNMIKDNKLTSNFNATPHTIVQKNGGDVQVRNETTGKEYRRNVMHLKKVEGTWKVDSDIQGDESSDSSTTKDMDTDI